MLSDVKYSLRPEKPFAGLAHCPAASSFALVGRLPWDASNLTLWCGLKVIREIKGIPGTLHLGPGGWTDLPVPRNE